MRFLNVDRWIHERPRTMLAGVCLALLCSWTLLGHEPGFDPLMHAGPSQRGVDSRAAAVLERYREAAGGRERLDKLRSLVAEGSGRRVPAFGKEAPAFSFRFRNPDSYQEVQLVPKNFAGPEVRTLNKQGHWLRGVTIAADPAGTNDRALAATRRRILEVLLGIAPTIASDNRLAVFSYNGVETNDGQESTGLAVTDASGQSALLYFSNLTGLPTKLVVRRVMTIPTPHEILVNVQYGDYRRVQGITLPFSIRRYGGETIAIDRYFVNPSLPEELFRSPATDSELQFVLNYHPRS